MKDKEEKKVPVNLRVSEKKLKIFKAIAMLKFEKNPITSAWEEAIDLFIEQNKKYLDEIK